MSTLFILMTEATTLPLWSMKDNSSKERSVNNVDEKEKGIFF